MYFSYKLQRNKTVNLRTRMLLVG